MDMPHMMMGLPPLTWSVFFHSWDFRPVWGLLIALASAAYIYGVVQVRRRDPAGFPLARVAAFLAGMAVLTVSLSSAVETYSHVLFWDHMVQHLLLIMVVPALLVVGHPLTVLQQASHGSTRAKVDAVLRSGPVEFLTHPLVGLGIYTLVIVGTHLTDFMNAMATRMWLHDTEQVLYVLGGYLFLLPLLGNEPIRWRPPHLVRMVVLFIAMAPDTVVGLVLLQTPHELFPALAADRPTWAPAPVHDLNIGGGIMWAFGDGLMMALILAVMLAYITRSESHATAGGWLEGVRRQTMAHNLGYGADGEPELGTSSDVDDDDDLLTAYNSMLERMAKQDQS